MFKSKIAIVDSDTSSASAYAAAFKEKYELFEFTSATSYLSFIQKENLNPFQLLIINQQLVGSKSGIDVIKFCGRINKSCPFIMTAGTFKKAELIEAHNLGALRLFEKPFKSEHLAKEIYTIFFQDHIAQLTREIENIALNMAGHAEVFVEVLSEFVANNKVNEYYRRHHPELATTKNADLKKEILHLEESLYSNLKMREVMKRQQHRSSSAPAPAPTKAHYNA